MNTLYDEIFLGITDGACADKLEVGMSTGDGLRIMTGEKSYAELEADNAALRQRVQELEARIERAKQAMRSTQENWREQCLFDAWNILEYGGDGVA